MAHLMIGICLSTGFYLLLVFAGRKRLKIKWGHWLLTILAFAYNLFILEVIIAFLEEGAVRAAFVIGIPLLFSSIVWGVLLARFVFFQKKRNQ
ncbi:MAG: hypothetical protein JXB26_04955 [Candidatus Aminicenantes bacterium]|nr:hypothetical protein [Candidatus Aminicenantes bacterium]